jgi:hypothetical protein
MMSSPWLRIPLSDYEDHMRLPSVGQATMLAEELDAALAKHSVSSLAVIGCAGGNGFDRVARFPIRRLVGIDFQAEYLRAASDRFSATIPGLELYCTDLQAEDRFPQIEPVDLVYAALIFEYVNLAAALRNLRRLCHPGSVLLTLLQQPNSRIEAVSPSPIASIQQLGPAMRLVSPRELELESNAQGFRLQSTKTIELKSGKRFSLQTFNRRTGEN